MFPSSLLLPSDLEALAADLGIGDDSQSDGHTHGVNLLHKPSKLTQRLRLVLIGFNFPQIYVENATLPISTF